MRKQELSHIHGLLVLTRQYLAEQSNIELPDDAFVDYDDAGVGPTSIAERKEAHKAAVDQLLDGFRRSFATHKEGSDALRPCSESIDASASKSS